MPKPVFDINEYELRGLVPDVFSEEQKTLLNKTLARVNGQIDWTAQMLGYSGPSYWGRSNSDADGSYNWVGLPETMNEKRQLQASTFGVFNKNLDYSQWPAPFNRSEIKASGDAKIHVWTENSKLKLGPLGQAETIDFSHEAVFFSGASYVFDAEVEFSAKGKSDEEAFWSTTFFHNNQTWTRLKVKGTGGFIGISLVNQEEPNELLVQISAWEDSSDWDYSSVTNQFIGVWGNKGGSLSFDAQFDSLDVHGFDERNGLSLNKVDRTLTLEYLLDQVGLEPTFWTPYANTEFGIRVGGCDKVYPIPTLDPGVLYDNDRYDRNVDQVNDSFLTSAVYDSGVPIPSDITDEGEYEKDDIVLKPLIRDDFEFFECESDCNYSLKLFQTYSDDKSPGIGQIGFKYKPKEDYALIDFPCIEWEFDPSLDNGSLENTIVFPTKIGPWATANGGEFDKSSRCYIGVQQGAEACSEGVWCGFDDGEFDARTEPNCEVIETGCAEADGGLFLISGAPNYDDCSCIEECCLIDQGIFTVTLSSYNETADGGLFLLGTDCVTHNNGEYLASADGFEPDILFATCSLDNGGFIYDSPPRTTADGKFYDRGYIDCPECTLETEAPTIPCPIEPVAVSLKSLFEGVSWTMKPSILNSKTPLRLWKSRPLTTIDEVEGSELTQYNFLVADENQGPDELGAHRHFARLPLEYPREGKFWNRTQAICNNQSYFSSPSQLSQTSVAPPISKPNVYSETYFELRESSEIVIYEEDYLVSTNRSDSFNVQEGFEDTRVTFESDKDSPFAFALIEQYTALDERTPHPDGEWRGSYYLTGTKAKKSGYLQKDLENQSLLSLEKELYPIYDMSTLKLPDTEFPDNSDEASVKNYVVSYAYFVSDFSAADDPVFDPSKPHCWREETIESKVKSDTSCVSDPIKSNTAYLLHT